MHGSLLKALREAWASPMDRETVGALRALRQGCRLHSCVRFYEIQGRRHVSKRWAPACLLRHFPYT